MKKFAVVALIVAVALLASCTTVQPLDAGANGKVGSKIGMASASWFLFPAALSGDMGVATAANNGGIKTIGTVDIKSEWKLIMGTYTTIVTGE